MSGLFFYPRVTDELIDQSSCACEPYWLGYRLDEGKEAELKQTTNHNRIILADGNDYWKVEDDGLLVRKIVRIQYPEALLGESGIAPLVAELSVCLIWVNDKLSQTGVIRPLRSLFDKGAVYEFEHYFEPGSIAGNLTLDTVLFVEKPADDLLPGEERLINEAGVLLGSLEPSVQLLLEDDYSDFPIGEFQEDDGPLWRLDFFEWEDPRVDQFSEENLILMLNTKHPDCPSFSPGGITNESLLREIIGSAYFLIFEKVREFEGGSCWNDTMTDSNLEKGSICKVLYWISEQDGDHQFDWSSLEGRMSCIKRIVDLNFREDSKAVSK